MNCIHGKAIYTGSGIVADAYLAFDGPKIAGISKSPRGKVVGRFAAVTPAFIDAHSHMGLTRSGEPSQESEVNERLEMVMPVPDALDSVMMDDPAFRETLQSVFEPQGFRTLLASDGEEAISIVRCEEVHLVLLDMHMPKLTGLETLRLVKQIKGLLPCIILSAHLDDLIVEQARMAHAFSVLPKPVTRIQLTGIVRQALEWTYNWKWCR